MMWFIRFGGAIDTGFGTSVYIICWTRCHWVRKIGFLRCSAINAMDSIYCYSCLILDYVESGRIELARYNCDRVTTCKACAAR